jgi:lysosomal acid lipase/cholesteryl ester hydrolase
MGCSMFFVAMATYPELQSKIELMVALAPATSLAHMTSPALRVAAPFIKHIEVDNIFFEIILK